MNPNSFNNQNKNDKPERYVGYKKTLKKRSSPGGQKALSQEYDMQKPDKVYVDNKNKCITWKL